MITNKETWEAQKALNEIPKVANIATSEPETPKNRVCLFCGEPLEGTNERKKFCNRFCTHHYKYRTDAKYKATLRARSQRYYKNNKAMCDRKNKKYFKECWIKVPANKKKFNDQMRVLNRIHQRKLHKERILNQSCLRCGGPRDEKFKTCRACLTRINNRNNGTKTR